MRRTIITGAVVGLVAALGLATPGQATPVTTPPQATVGIFHGVPKTPVDVYVGKSKVVDDFQPGTFAGPLKLAPGTYTVRITAADATSAKHPIIGPARIRLAAGGNYSVIAHLTAKGAPTATVYKNDLSRVQNGFGRVIVRHVAAAPRVDVLLNGVVAVDGLKNPHQAKARVAVGDYSAAVTLAGSSAPVLGPVDLTVAANTNTILYAWGSAKDGTLALTPRVVPTLP